MDDSRAFRAFDLFLLIYHEGCADRGLRWQFPACPDVSQQPNEALSCLGSIASPAQVRFIALPFLEMSSLSHSFTVVGSVSHPPGVRRWFRDIVGAQ